MKGIGCPTNAQVVIYPSNPQTYTDAACPTGDNKDHTNQGLLLSKTGPTANFAAGEADFTNVTGLSLTEVGYDLRSASHCGSGAPRFDIVTQDMTDHFIGCNSPPPTVLSSSPRPAAPAVEPGRRLPTHSAHRYGECHGHHLGRGPGHWPGLLRPGHHR